VNVDPFVDASRLVGVVAGEHSDGVEGGKLFKADDTFLVSVCEALARRALLTEAGADRGMALAQEAEGVARTSPFARLVASAGTGAAHGVRLLEARRESGAESTTLGRFLWCEVRRAVLRVNVFDVHVREHP